jgi:hypothetical protein
MWRLSQSYDFKIYKYVQRKRCGGLERFFKVEENIFVLKTH